MGKIKKLLESELIGGSQNSDIYPVTSIKAVFGTDNRRLDDIISEIDGQINKTACKTLFRNCYVTVTDDTLNYYVNKGTNSASCSNLLTLPDKDFTCENVANTTSAGYANVPAVLFFDANFNYISCIFHSSNDALLVEKSSIPSNAVFFAIQSRGSNFQTFTYDGFTGVYDTGINVYLLDLIKKTAVISDNALYSSESSLKSSNISVSSTSGYYIRKADGNTSSYSNGKVSKDFIPLEGYTTVKYTGSYGQMSCIAAFYDKDKKFISSIGDSETIVNVTDYSIDLQSVEGAVYVKFSSLNSTLKAIIETSNELYVDISSIEEDISSIDTRLGDTITDISNIRENVGIRSEYNISNLELANSKESTYFGMIFDEEVNITSLKYMSETVKTDNKIVICGPEIDDTKKVVVKNIIPIADSQIGENTVSDINITVSKGCSLFILGNDKYVSNGNFTIVKSSIGIGAVGTAKVGDTLSYGQKLSVQKAISITGVLINPVTEDNIAEIVKKYTVEAGTNYLNKKILCVTGDSEAAGHSIGKQNTYGALIADRNNMTVYNTAVNGRKLAYVEGSTGSGTPLVQAIDEIREDADYILCQIGYNDSFDESEEDDSTDITKYKGAFNTVIEGWQSRCPKARIGIIIPYYFNNESSRIKRAEWMKQRCEHYHIQYIDGTIKSGLNYNSEEQKSIYFIDTVHLTALGHERMSYLYEQFMRSL